MTWRTITVSDKNYTWKCGNIFLVIKGEDEKKRLIPIGYFFGISKEELEKSRDIGSSLYVVTPRMVSDYIKMIEEEKLYELKKKETDKKRGKKKND